MTRLKLLSATAILATAIASPALAQQMAREPFAAHHVNRGYGDRDSGFWPADVAAGVVGGALGAAGAIATAPFRGNSYAYYDGRYDDGYNNGYATRYDDGYAARNWFVCQPGTWFRGEDGRRHICQ